MAIFKIKKIIPLLAIRYLKQTAQEKNVSLFVKLVFWGIALGTFSLTLILGIMHGAEKATFEKLQGIHARIIMRSLDGTLDVHQIKKVLLKEFPQVIAVSPVATEQIIIRNRFDNEYHVVTIKGIDPSQEIQVTTLQEKITRGIQTLSEALARDGIIVGEALARQLSTACNDTISLTYSPSTDFAHMQLQEKKAHITAFFKTGIDDFDSSLVICSLPLFFTMFSENGIHQLNLAVGNGCDEEKLIDDLRHRFGIEVYSWKELYPALISALTLEKYVMASILFLIIVMASFSLISLLGMQIIQKQLNIAILRTLGMGITTIQKIFIVFSTILTLSATFFGLMSALIIGHLLEKIPWIQLPDIYYVTHLPFYLESHVYLVVLSVVLLLGFMATLIPLKKIGSLACAQVLKESI